MVTQRTKAREPSRVAKLGDDMITPTDVCETMNQAYDKLQELTIDELKSIIDRAPYEFSRAFSAGIFEEYRDAYAAECLMVHQCRETIRRKQLEYWK